MLAEYPEPTPPHAGLSQRPDTERSDAEHPDDRDALRREVEWLRAERARYRAVAELTPGLAFDLRASSSGRLAIQWVNPALQRLLEFESDRGQTDVCRYLFAEDQQKSAGYLRALRSGQRVEGHLRLITPSRGVRHLRFWAQPVGAGAQRVYGAAEDVTAYRHAEVELRHTQERLRSLMRGLPGTVSRVSSDLRYLEVNEQLAGFFNRAPAEFVNQPIDFLGAGRELQHVLERFFESELEQDAFELSPVIRGQQRHLMIVAHKHNAGSEAQLIGIDVTEQRQAEARVRAKEQLYRALVETAPEAILVVDYEQRQIVDANVNAAHLLGHAAAVLVGQPLDVISPPWQPDGRVSADRLAMLMQRALSEPVTEEWMCRDGDGLDRLCELRLSQLSTTPRLIRCSLRDLTEQKYRERELMAAREQAEAMTQIRASFLANMSHEFRTPLTGIIGFSALLSENAQDEQREMVGVIERSGTRLLRLLNGILDLATLEAGGMEVAAADLDVGRELREAVRLHSAAAAEKGLTLDLDLPEQPLRAILDPTLFQRVLASLLDNAIRFTQTGGAVVRLRQGPGGIQIIVEDTGIGISPSFLPFVFEGFSQESTGIARTHEGSGLGLAITKHLVELMEGTITATSTRGEGSAFKVTFPSIETESPAEREPSPVAAAFPTSAVDAPQASILAVEDSADAQRMLHYCLGTRHRLDAVATEEEALRLAEAHTYDLVLMDVNLGAKRDGTDVLQELRTMPAYATTPIIAVTAYAMPGDRERFLRCGFDGYIGKPFTSARVQELVQEVLAPRLGGGDGASA
ncbi:MAG: ATP-binding protein [Bacteroidota bacterium]